MTTPKNSSKSRAASEKQWPESRSAPSRKTSGSPNAAGEGDKQGITVGVLALQGCIDPHLDMLKKIGVAALRVRTPEELARVDRLIMPGGESSTMLKLLNSSGLFAAIKEFSEQHAIWGICAGAILCAKEVVNPSQQSLGLINLRAHRNFYGTQLNSFKASIEIEPLHRALDVDFIRAPRLESLAPSVTVLAKSSDGTPVLFKESRVLAGAFHAELGSDPVLHRYFVENV